MYLLRNKTFLSDSLVEERLFDGLKVSEHGLRALYDLQC